MLTNSVLQVSQVQELGLSDSAWLARVCVCAKWLQLGLTLCNTVDYSPPAPLSMGFSKLWAGALG